MARNPFQTEDRIDRAIECLSRMRTPDARALLSKEWKVTPSAVEKVFAQARRCMLEAAGVDKQQARGEILASLDAVILNPKARDSDRIQACKVKARLLGVNAVTLPTLPPPMFDLEAERHRLLSDSVKQVSDHELLPAIDVRQDDGEGVQLPAAPASTRNGVHEVDPGPDVQQTGH